MVEVSLREVTIENFQACIDLEVEDDQEKFVATNTQSIALSKVAPHLIPNSIYADGELVGFSLSGRDERSKKYYIVRLMIGKQHQRKGFGKAATLKLIDQMSRNKDCDQISLFFVPGNKGAEKLYSSLGFKRTGIIDEDGEIEMSLELTERD